MKYSHKYIYTWVVIHAETNTIKTVDGFTMARVTYLTKTPMNAKMKICANLKTTSNINRGASITISCSADFFNLITSGNF